MQDLITFISNHSMLGLATALIVVLLLIVEFMRAKRANFQITPQQATQKINHDNAVILDLRPKESFTKGHIIDAYSIDINEYKSSFKKLDKFRAKPLILVCNTGLESQKTAALLIKDGYNAYTIAGGMRAWCEAQMPIVTKE